MAVHEAVWQYLSFRIGKRVEDYRYVTEYMFTVRDGPQRHLVQHLHFPQQGLRAIYRGDWFAVDQERQLGVRGAIVVEEHKADQGELAFYFGKHATPTCNVIWTEMYGVAPQVGFQLSTGQITMLDSRVGVYTLLPLFQCLARRRRQRRKRQLQDEPEYVFLPQVKDIAPEMSPITGKLRV